MTPAARHLSRATSAETAAHAGTGQHLPLVMASINYKKFEKMMKDQMQASSTKLGKIQAASGKPQAASFKLQAASGKLLDI